MLHAPPVQERPSPGAPARARLPFFGGPARALLAAACLSTATLTLAAPPASAQPTSTSPDTEERRTRLFKEGKAAADAGQWADAAAKFRQVVAIRSAPKALIALGVAEERTGHLVAALTAYKQAREEAADKTLTDELRTANAALEALRPRVPRLTFSPPGALAGATLELDGAPATPAEDGLPVDPGDHTLVATAPGKGTFRTSVSLKEGDRRDLPVVFGASTPPTSSADSGPAPSETTRSAAPPTATLALGISGLVLAGVGGALYGVGSGQYADSEKLCPAACAPDIAAKGNDGRTLMIAGDALLLLGAAAAVGAGIYWAVSATSTKKPATTLLVTPRVAGLDLVGRF